MIDIVLTSWYRAEMTKLTIKTIRRNTKPGTYRLIVIDNGSPKKQQDMLQSLHDKGYIDELILLPTNLGLEPAHNVALANIQSDYFVIADNDCLPEPMYGTMDWLERLQDLMSAHPGYAAIACRYPVMIGTGNIYEDAEHRELVGFPHPGGSLRLMLTSAVKETGGWRDNVPSRGSEERYICGKLHELGYKTAFAVHITTLHLFGNREKNTDRWGYQKDWTPEQSGHSDVWHPVFGSGDNPAEVERYSGTELTREYYADSDN